MNKLELKKNISLSNFTTWGIGGRAEWIAQPKNNEEIKYLSLFWSYFFISSRLYIPAAE